MIKRQRRKIRTDLPPGVKLLGTIKLNIDTVSFAFDASGQTLAISTKDQGIQLWNADSGKLIRRLQSVSGQPLGLAFDSAGRLLAAGATNGTVRIWDVATAKQLRGLRAHKAEIFSVTFDPTGQILASAGTDDGTVKLWDAAKGRLLRTLQVDDESYTVAFDPKGSVLASGGYGNAVNLWDPASGALLRTLQGHDGAIFSVSFDPVGGILASGGSDQTVRLWDPSSGKLIRTLEGPTNSVVSVAFHKRSRLFAADCGDDVRVWDSKTWDAIAVIRKTKSPVVQDLAFHPLLPRLVMGDGGRLLRVYELDLNLLLGAERYLQIEETAHYVNAKIVLVGDTGVGKSGLSLVLTGRAFEATISTPGRHVSIFSSFSQKLDGNRTQTREALLWDLAGQPGYRIIHQLHLNEVSVALVVFDARSETDPLAGVLHWERALRVAHQRQGNQAVPPIKLLVSARADRGGVPVSKARLDTIMKEFHFDDYFATSAQEGWQIEDLKAAIERAIPWDALPIVSSSALFVAIRTFVLEVKESGRLLVPLGQLFEELVHNKGPVLSEEGDLRAEFNACIGRLENRDLVRRLSFGDYILLQPELLDAYASAMVVAAKDEPDGLGSISEEIALAGRFHIPKEQRLKDRKEEQVLLHATVEELVQHELALRESAADGRYLVFPSQFNRDYEDAPEPPGKAVAVTFEGPTQSLYSTLAVRLGHSGLFETTRTEMWRNAVIFAARAGGKCGIYLQEFAEGRGRLLLFFDVASDETRFHFEEYVVAHLRRRALDGTVQVTRFYECENCGNPVPDAYVKLLRDKGQDVFACPCGRAVRLTDPRERLVQRYPSQIEPMDRAADRQRDFDTFVLSASAETRSRGFSEWAGGERVTLAIVFTDVVGSTAIGEKIKDESMNSLRRQHFAQSRELIAKHNGREIKTIGDSFMAAFRSVGEAFDYARALQADPGGSEIHMRAGIHIGAMQVEEGDLFGTTVNFAARVVGAIRGAEIWLSDQAKVDIDSLGARRHKDLQWRSHDVELKGFTGVFRLWSLS